MPYKAPKYRPNRQTGNAKYVSPLAGANRFDKESQARADRRKHYQSVTWRKFREQARQAARERDQQLINRLMVHNGVSYYEVKSFLDDAKQYPLCVKCLKKGEYVSALILDHIEPYRPEKGMALCDEQNIQWLCSSCHNRKSQSDR